ncbi:MAG: ATPase, T2SS/T4P/T4SS family [Planctomycetota bacterium]
MRELVTRAVIESGLLDEERLEECLQLEEETGQTLDKILVHKGYLTEKDALVAFGEVLGIPFRERLEGVAVPDDFINRVPVHFARNFNLVALGERNGALTVATCAPFETYPMDDLASMLSVEVEPVLAPRAEITSLINKAYKRKADTVDEALTDLDEDDIGSLAGEIEIAEDILDVANKAPIIKLLNMVLFQGLRMRASDIHLQPYDDRLQVRYRIDGILYDMDAIPKKVQEAVISRVKVMGKMDIAERRLPQDGRSTIKLGDSEVDVRISTVPTSAGERVVMRLLDLSARLYELEEIGLDERNRNLLDGYIHYSHGIVFVTGPTGSGKTTTLYASLSRINSAVKNVITIEDPIEYHLDSISQIQVSEKKGLTFASGLRALVRQDPDIMMIGEVRDDETARIATQSALTGHLVFSTLHTNDAPSAVARMLNFNVEPYLLASSLLVVVAQRLVRKVCPECRDVFAPDATMVRELEMIGLTPDQLQDGKLVRGAGCANCFQTGYTDRTGIYEILPVDDTVKLQIMERASSTDIKRSAVERGLLRTLRQDGADKVRQGQTTVEEVVRVTQLDVF